MENNISKAVRFQCRKQGITMRQLADKMQIAPESLSRAINGNPTLSTIQSIAQNLNVEVSSLFQTQLAQTDLTAIVVWRGKTLVTDDINSLIDFATDIKNALQSEEITEKIINPIIIQRNFIFI